MSPFRDRILSLLRERPHSFAELAQRLGLDAEGARRAVADLKALGHLIASEAPDRVELVAPLTEDGIRAHLPVRHRFGSVLEVHPVVGSTNDIARALGDAGAPEGTAIVADQQSAGRGRSGRAWYSPPNRNLYVSVLLRPQLEPSQAPAITLVAGLAAARAVESQAGLRPRLKWPNDLLLEGRKIGGLLTEMSTDEGGIRWVVIGLGLNVNMNADHLPSELRDSAGSLQMGAGRSLDRGELCARFLGSLEEWVGRFYREGASAVLPEWTSRSDTLGKRVRTPQGDRVIEGVATRLDDDGALLVQTDSGETVRVFAGDIQPG